MGSTVDDTIGGAIGDMIGSTIRMIVSTIRSTNRMYIIICGTIIVRLIVNIHVILDVTYWFS